MAEFRGVKEWAKGQSVDQVSVFPLIAAKPLNVSVWPGAASRIPRGLMLHLSV
jgi:hypothetical protein